MDDLRRLPSVDLMLQGAEAQTYISLYGRHLTLDAIREILSIHRSKIKAKEQYDLPDIGELMADAGRLLDSWMKPRLVPVINATGVILHTNLGRAPLSRAAH